MAKITTEQLEYSIEVLTNQLKVDAGEYFAEEIVKQQAADESPDLKKLLEGLVKDSSVDEHCYALSATIQILNKMIDKLENEEDE